MWGYIISFLVDLVIVVLAIGFLSNIFCSDFGMEWNGGVWFISIVITVIIVGLIYWLIWKWFDKH
jgi:hypothetical protein